MTTTTTITPDKALIKQVYKEEIADYTIYGTLTSLGNLEVIVLYDRDTNVTWRGDNILAAREWIKARVAL